MCRRVFSCARETSYKINSSSGDASATYLSKLETSEKDADQRVKKLSRQEDQIPESDDPQRTQDHNKIELEHLN